MNGQQSTPAHISVMDGVLPQATGLEMRFEEEMARAIPGWRSEPSIRDQDAQDESVNPCAE